MRILLKTHLHENKCFRNLSAEWIHFILSPDFIELMSYTGSNRARVDIFMVSSSANKQHKNQVDHVLYWGNVKCSK